MSEEDIENLTFFYIKVFFHRHWQLTGKQGKGWNHLLLHYTTCRGQGTYYDRFGLLNSNSVLVARHFQYRAEVFFREIVVNGLLGKSKYYAICVEFQVRGLPHVHWKGMLLLLIKLFMHSFLTEIKIQNFIIFLNYMNFTDIQEHVEKI